MNVKYKDKMPKQESEVALGNLYDVNKRLMANEEPLTENAINERIIALRDWLVTTEEKIHSKYYMLLCHEARDYTLFNLDKTGRHTTLPETNYLSAAADVIDCLCNRGTLIAVDYQTDSDAWELWIKTDSGCYAFYLFPYGQAVLEY